MDDKENDERTGATNKNLSEAGEFADLTIECIDCETDFVWTIGEQEFFRDKGLKHAPKRCRGCKKAKTERIAEGSRAAREGTLKIEVKVVCDACRAETTVPFYPSQGRPVLCRSCFLAEDRKI
ncbi:MAG: zinc-ribbon domain containing protein [Acidobacteriota bacterium]|nr:zinc-ribbon domain containing protein [Acidobacteriota bacterium]MDH3529353.1 zinc-ribbon domain containing protein [Acidobacteriota bacterium]